MKDERVKEAFEKIEEGVSTVFQSEKWERYLKIISKFHNYSANNCLLILMQCPDATFVTGASQWKQFFKRYVNQGETAIRILAPVPYTRVVMQDEQQVEIPSVYFKTTSVFDISQTSGEDLPLICRELKGNSDEMKKLLELVHNIIPSKVEYWQLKGDLKGFYRPDDDLIVVKKNMDDLAKLKTIIHEWAHSILHKNSNKSKEQKEIEAESISYVVNSYFGLETGEYSFEYIASFSQNKTPEELRKILSNIQQTAKTIINLIIEKEREEKVC